MSAEPPTIEFRHRFVPFGTKFTPADGPRTAAHQAGPNQLFQNEIVTDVGGVCWGHNGETLRVIDHHFFREEGQYPSAAAAVLHNAKRIADWSKVWLADAPSQDSAHTVWLVTHINPDFDALSSLYLVRRLIDGMLEVDDWDTFGLLSDGWRATRNEVNWFRPKTTVIPPSRRWAILFAAEASRTDNCRESRCPRERRLNSVLCAAMERGRNYADECNGGVEFFDEVRLLLSQGAGEGLDPYFDSVLEGSNVFRAELSILDREVVAYERDLRRARKLVVYVPESRVPFSQWFPDSAAAPLLDSKGEIHPKHTDSKVHRRRAVDGLFLRDPESLLFKNWARGDTENSSLGRGFTFTGICYSNGRSGSSTNTGDYYFAIDPESAGRMHLYSVWAQLQAAEFQALKSPPNQVLRDQLQAQEAQAKQAGKTCVRTGFGGRATLVSGETLLGFDDPWFDGQNYACTIIPTPNRGTLLSPPGICSDLSDDPVAQIVLEELTDSVFGENMVLQEFPGAANDQLSALPETFAALRKVTPLRLSGYRFLSVELDSDIDLRSTDFTLQIAARLWRFLDHNRSGVPEDFQQRHVFRGDDWLGVWNDRGVVAAYRPSAAARAGALQQLFENVCQLALRMRTLIDNASKQRESADLSTQLSRSEEMLVELALRNHEMTLPEHALVRSFVEASRLDRSLEMIRDIHSAAADRMEADRMRSLAQTQTQTAASMNDGVTTLISLQQKLEYVEVGIVLVYAAELTHILAHSFEFAPFYTGIGVIVCPLFAAIAAYCWLIAGGDHHRSSRSPSTKRLPAAAIATLVISIALIAGFVICGLSFSSLRKPHDEAPKTAAEH